MLLDQTERAHKLKAAVGSRKSFPLAIHTPIVVAAHNLAHGASSSAMESVRKTPRTDQSRGASSQRLAAGLMRGRPGG